MTFSSRKVDLKVHAVADEPLLLLHFASSKLTTTHHLLTYIKMVANESLIFQSPPEGFPVPGETLTKTTSEIDLDADIPAGSVLAKTVVLSLDPYMVSCSV